MRGRLYTVLTNRLKYVVIDWRIIPRIFLAGYRFLFVNVAFYIISKKPSRGVKSRVRGRLRKALVFRAQTTDKASAKQKKKKKDVCNFFFPKPNSAISAQEGHEDHATNCAAGNSCRINIYRSMLLITAIQRSQRSTSLWRCKPLHLVNEPGSLGHQESSNIKHNALFSSYLFR